MHCQRGWHTEEGAESDIIRGLISNGYRPGRLAIAPKGGVNSDQSIRSSQHWMRAAADG